MAYQPDLSTRHQNILKATIRHYIATAEPVGSKTLAQEYDLKVSSATIRNAMGRLEEAGLLYQPHISAGRIPSDSGYRTYVDRLIVPDDNISKIIEKSLQQELQIAKASFEALLQRATKVLAALSGYIALITFPQNLNSTLRHLQLVRVAPGQVMLIVVTDSYQTQSILMESPLENDNEDRGESVIESELQILSNFLDHELKGRSLAEIATLNWSEIGEESWVSFGRKGTRKFDREFKQYTDFLNALSNQLRLSFQATSFSPIVIHGVAECLRQPEFSQLQQIQALLYLLEEEQEQLLPVIFTTTSLKDSLKRVSIKIGAENYLEPMRTCSLVSANYYQDKIPVGSVGIIGPTRMLYENAIALVETTADYLSDAFK
jgi:heat-inducible transcriptional repressor